LEVFTLELMEGHGVKAKILVSMALYELQGKNLQGVISEV
jgi:hypothetical protein